MTSSVLLRGREEGQREEKRFDDEAKGLRDLRKVHEPQNVEASRNQGKQEHIVLRASRWSAVLAVS